MRMKNYMSKKINREKNIKIIFIISCFVVLSSVIYFLSTKSEIVHIQEMPVVFNITEQRIIGINIDTDALRFGTIMRGHSVERKFTIINPFDFPVKVSINFSKDVSDFVTIPYYDFVLIANESLKLPINIKTNSDSEIKWYNGTMTVVMERIKI